MCCGRLADHHVGRLLDDPGEVVLADRVDVGVRRRVAEVDGVGDAVAHRHLDGVEVVAEPEVEGQHVVVHLLEQRRDRPAAPFRT